MIDPTAVDSLEELEAKIRGNVEGGMTLMGFPVVIDETMASPPRFGSPLDEVPMMLERDQDGQYWLRRKP